MSQGRQQGRQQCRLRPSVRLMCLKRLPSHWAGRRGQRRLRRFRICQARLGRSRQARVGQSRRRPPGPIPPGPPGPIPPGAPWPDPGVRRANQHHTKEAESQTPAVRRCSGRRGAVVGDQRCLLHFIARQRQRRHHGQLRVNQRPRLRPAGNRSRMRALPARRRRPHRPTAPSGFSGGWEAMAASADGTRAMTLPSTAGRAATIYPFRFSMRCR